MAYFLFLGAIILGYFLYEKFLRRIFARFFEYHQIVENNARENYLSPATTIAAGQDELWDIKFPENRFNGPLYSYAESNSHLENNNVQVVEGNFVEEEEDLRKKDSIYLKALNSGRPSGHPKIRKLPDVGYLPTIFEKMPWPLTATALISCMEEESEKTESIAEEQYFEKLTEYKAEEELAEHKAEKVSVPSQLTVNETGDLQDRMQLKENLAQEKKEHVELIEESAVEESVRMELTENIEEPVSMQLRNIAEKPVNEASQISKKKKKKFRGLRKFFSRFSCIPKAKHENK